MGFAVRSKQDPSTGNELHEVTSPARGEGRERARGALLEIFQRAVDQNQRLRFRVTVGVHEPLALGSRGGYDPAAVLTGVHAEFGDPFAWLLSQLADRTNEPASAITKVLVLASSPT